MSGNVIILISICGGLPVLALGGVGVYLIISWWRGKVKAEKSQFWLLAEGEVIDTEVRFSGSFHGGEAFLPVIRYRYTVGEQTYQSKNFSFGKGPRFLVSQEADAFLNTYQPGDHLDIYYNPRNPSEAVVERTPHGTKSGLIAGILFIVPFFCMVCFLAVLIVDQIIKIF